MSAAGAAGPVNIFTYAQRRKAILEKVAKARADLATATGELVALETEMKANAKEVLANGWNEDLSANALREIERIVSPAPEQP